MPISPVITIRNAVATAKINVTKLRSNVGVLEGSGGNIAVLTGRDGALLVDAGITASRPRITEALASLSSDPVKHLINSHSAPLRTQRVCTWKRVELHCQKLRHLWQ
jgi:glyoxylase-like metal-dependent hydrolase (beta-lactamase superfamily II)